MWICRPLHPLSRLHRTSGLVGFSVQLDAALTRWWRVKSLAEGWPPFLITTVTTSSEGNEAPKRLNRIRILLSVFIAGLVLSGATAIPLESELKLLTQIVGADAGAEPTGLGRWVVSVRDALVETNARYPFIAYGTDWLAFAHFVIAVAFIGSWRDPVKNIWVVEFGMIACVLVVPFALVMGGVRGIPMGWRLIDCSFGALGMIPLWLCRRQIQRLAQIRE